MPTDHPVNKSAELFKMLHLGAQQQPFLSTVVLMMKDDCTISTIVVDGENMPDVFADGIEQMLPTIVSSLRSMGKTVH